VINECSWFQQGQLLVPDGVVAGAKEHPVGGGTLYLAVHLFQLLIGGGCGPLSIELTGAYVSTLQVLAHLAEMEADAHDSATGDNGQSCS
jgi:hypothetical protein